ncbi:MAG: Hsp20/alpha crystallin family protein [Desulfovibrionales bacterium]|nr:Hsp20/alpha crystallin family protein [Desulfovibrionales bacterium]
MTQELEKKSAPALLRFRPNTDVLEREDGFYIFVDMPGVSKDNLSIDLRENELEVCGKAVYPRMDKAKALHVEFGDGEYVRTFTISDGVDRDGIRATMNKGLLELYLPKAARFSPRRIEIQPG